MRVLLLAPEPFYQLRGTPIAVKRLAEVLSRRGWLVDILTFHEGSDVEIPRVRVFRIPRIPWTCGVRPGFSLKKLACDLALFASAARRLRRESYDLVHAGEESAFIALLFRWAAGYSYVYDMDSRLSEQMAGSHPSMRPFMPIIRRLEGLVIRNASAVLAVCDALAEYAREQGARHVVVLPDAPLCAPASESARPAHVRGADSGAVFMYIGNLEQYQGIDLLIESFSRLARSNGSSTLEIIGGSPEHIRRYEGVCREKNLSDKIHFRGAHPPEKLGEFMAGADVLVSPRCHGVNTPMKIYSYLQAGKPVLATNIPSHSQVLSGEFALLAPPEPEALAHAMARLAADPVLRAHLGERALRVARTRYAPENFDRTALAFCDLAERLIAGDGRPALAVSASR